LPIYRDGIEGGSVLGSACFMLWDLSPLMQLPWRPICGEVEGALLTVLEEALSSNSNGCIQSALHGLGHCDEHQAGSVETIITRFLAAHPSLDPALRDYAIRAKNGAIL